jgi:predicted dehydrogenase
MIVLVGNKWRRNYLSYFRSPEQLRIRVHAMVNVERICDVYFRPPLSASLLLAYWREVGTVQVLRKVRSRMSERERNEKYISCGIGVISEGTSKRSFFREGTQVGFIAPQHPACLSEIVLSDKLVFALEEMPLFEGADCVLHTTLECNSTERLLSMAGWYEQSGRTFTSSDWAGIRTSGMEILRKTRWKGALRLPLSRDASGVERRHASADRIVKPKPTAVLFGYGHYAKTNILPSVKPYCDVRCIHEIDPMQMTNQAYLSWDTSPGFRAEEHYDVAFLAGYHHTHAPLAVSALERRTRAVVVEKPIATSWSDLEKLESSLNKAPTAQFYCAFQKRYSVISLRVRDHFAGHEALSYHCIVYEVPLPERHWYRWPASGSRVLSNGCHWIDHFLYLNNFARPISWDVRSGPEGEVTCMMTLENGAYFTMLLSEQGSGRIGMRDYVEVRSGKYTARITNDRMCELDSPSRIIKVQQQSRTNSYGRMYAEIGRRIRDGLSGDSRHSVMTSARAVLNIHDGLHTQSATLKRAI